MGVLSPTNIDLGAGNLLGIADGGVLSTDLHSTLDLALQYIANWYRATKGSDNQDLWWAKIDAVRAKVESAERQITSDDVFPNTAEQNLYNDASAAYADLYSQLQLSADTLPQPALIDQAADLATTIVETPSYLITQAANLVGKTLNDTAKNFFLQAWPVLLVAGVGLGVYFFRRPLARLAGAL